MRTVEATQADLARLTVLVGLGPDGEREHGEVCARLAGDVPRLQAEVERLGADNARLRAERDECLDNSVKVWLALGDCLEQRAKIEGAS